MGPAHIDRTVLPEAATLEAEPSVPRHGTGDDPLP